MLLRAGATKLFSRQRRVTSLNISSIGVLGRTKYRFSMAASMTRVDDASLRRGLFRYRDRRSRQPRNRTEAPGKTDSRN
jgi:hypothetical protein